MRERGILRAGADFGLREGSSKHRFSQTIGRRPAKGISYQLKEKDFLNSQFCIFKDRRL